MKPGQVFNRIHVDDIVGAVLAGMAVRESRTVNVVDDEPAPPQDVVAFGADLLGLPAPPEVSFEGADLSPMGRQFYGANRRVSNARLKTTPWLCARPSDLSGRPARRSGRRDRVASPRPRSAAALPNFGSRRSCPARGAVIGCQAA